MFSTAMCCNHSHCNNQRYRASTPPHASFARKHRIAENSGTDVGSAHRRSNAVPAIDGRNSGSNTKPIDNHKVQCFCICQCALLQGIPNPADDSRIWRVGLGGAIFIRNGPGQLVPVQK